MTDWRDQLRDLGFGNQAVIVGTKRRELFDEIENIRKQTLQPIEDIVEDLIHGNHLHYSNLAPYVYEDAMEVEKAMSKILVFLMAQRLKGST